MDEEEQPRIIAGGATTRRVVVPTSSCLADVPKGFRSHEPALRFTYAMRRRNVGVRIAAEITETVAFVSEQPSRPRDDRDRWSCSQATQCCGAAAMSGGSGSSRMAGSTPLVVARAGWYGGPSIAR
jgi:hypothetical protein